MEKILQGFIKQTVQKDALLRFGLEEKDIHLSTQVDNLVDEKARRVTLSIKSNH